jgi:hypothetical protein
MSLNDLFLELPQNAVPGERRHQTRYQLPLRLSYRSTDSRRRNFEGTGTVKNLSSDGIFFSAVPTPAIFAGIEITIDWPIRHADGDQMELLLSCYIIRFSQDGIAARINRRKLQKKVRAGSEECHDEAFSPMVV